MPKNPNSPPPLPHILLYTSLQNRLHKSQHTTKPHHPILISPINEDEDVINELTLTLHTNPFHATPPTFDIPCSHCHRTPMEGVQPAQLFVSKNYTNWDTQTPYYHSNKFHTYTYWWCQACTWVHTTPQLRTFPLLLTHNTHTVTLAANPSYITTTLLNQPPPLQKNPSLQNMWTLSYPKNTTKHSLPHTRWNHITTKAGTTPWTRKEQKILQLLTQINHITPHTLKQLTNPLYNPPPNITHLPSHITQKLYALYLQLETLNPKNNPQHDTLTQLAHSAPLKNLGN